MAQAKPRTTSAPRDPSQQKSPPTLSPGVAGDSFAMPVDDDHMIAPEDRDAAQGSTNGLDYAVDDEGLDYRRRYRGLIGIASKVPIRDRSVLSLVYTPGVAEACLAIKEDPLRSYDLTCRGNTVAILTDGSDIFGREQGPAEAAIPLAEAKSVIFKTFAGIDAFPVCLATHDLSL